MEWQRVAFDRIRQLPVERHARLGQGRGSGSLLHGTEWRGGGYPGVYCLVEGEGSESLLLSKGIGVLEVYCLYRVRSLAVYCLVQGGGTGNLLLGTAGTLVYGGGGSSGSLLIDTG